MKKIILGILLFVTPAWAAAQDVVSVKTDVSVQETKQRKKAFKARRSEMDRLVKKYKKASESEKAVIKARLEELVSQNVEDGISYAKKRLQQEQNYLNAWEQRIKDDEARLPEIKTQRVEDLLAGTAKEKHRLAKKRWKAQVKAMKKRWR